ncbi:XK-related protein 9-like [Daphnia pulex]|uniref:XK-related protein 9-like n=1 Tax=Daphnia pulex TaxID=6669 RepID=UPI001EDD4CE9|nr:XK-related protein 9-like [Daphnia pulex]XP_046454118.1 XK-related protein 9-like [Daphnia pulex]
MGAIKRKKDPSTQEPVNSQPPSQVVEFAQKCKENIEISSVNWLIFFTCFSCFCYVGDICWDIYLLNCFWNTKYYWYFRCTLVFLITPIVVITFKSFSFYNNGFKNTDTLFDHRHSLPKEEYRFSNWVKWVLGPVGLCLIPRYWDIIRYADKAKQAKLKNDEKQYMYFVAMIWEDAELVQLSQFDCFMESAPQLLLNLYMLVKGESDLGVYTAIGFLFPIISLSWAIVSYDKKCCLVKGIKPDEGNRQGRMSFLNDDAIDCYKTFNWKKRAILFSAHFFGIIARFIALSLFTSVFGWIVWPACLAHLMPIFFWHRNENYGFMDSLRLSFLHVFAYLYPAEKVSDQKKHPRFSPVVYQTVCICENLFLMLLWSRSFIKSDEGINLGISSIQFYPWNDWKFSFPWIAQILMFISSFISFRLLNKHQKTFVRVTRVSSVPSIQIQE